MTFDFGGNCSFKSSVAHERVWTFEARRKQGCKDFDLPVPMSTGKISAMQDLNERGQTIQTHKTHNQKEEKTGH